MAIPPSSRMLHEQKLFLRLHTPSNLLIYIVKDKERAGKQMNEKVAFLPAFIQSYFIAVGVLLGGAMIGALGAFLSGGQPLTAMYRFAGDLRIWAVVAAIGGTFDTFYVVERGLFLGETKDIVRQFLLILSAMGGAQTGVAIITWLTQEHISP